MGQITTRVPLMKRRKPEDPADAMDQGFQLPDVNEVGEDQPQK